MQLIAEAGVNFNTIEEAKEMIRQSKQARATYTKFQLFNDEIIRDSPLYGVLKDKILTKKQVQILYNYGEEIKQPVFFTPMYLEAVDWITELNIPLIKIRYADRHNIPLIRKILDTDKRIIMSIDRQYEPSGLVLTHTHRIDFLLCVPKYPASAADYMLNKSTFNIFSGISDHTPNLELTRKALKLNDNMIIEKHVKLDDNCIEKDWSITFDKLRSLLEGEDEK